MDRNTAVGGNKPTAQHLSEGDIWGDPDLGHTEKAKKKQVTEKVHKGPQKKDSKRKNFI